MNSWINQTVFGIGKTPCLSTCTGSEWVASKHILNKTRSRIIVVITCFLIAYFAVIARMFHLSLISIDSDQVKAGSELQIINSKRSDILDRNGLLLATSLKTQSLYADPKKILDAEQAAKKINLVFPDLAVDELLKKLQDKKHRFMWIKRNLTPKQIMAVNQLGLPGVDFLEETRRIYPQGNVTSHVIGYTDIDHKGLSGLERGLQNILQETKDPIQTSIDIRLQHILHRQLQQAINDFSAIGGGGLIMDIHTGEIHAMVSLPDFNPHVPGKITDVQRFNRTTLGAYEMGSTFKTFTTAALLEFTNTSISTIFETRYPLKRAGFRISDFHPENRPLNLPEVYVHSSNIGTALMAERVGTEKMKSFFKDIGLFEKPNFEIKELAKPMVPNPWQPISTITASYGHGIAVSALQLASATASMINGGYKIYPTLVKRPKDFYKNVTPVRLISEETSNTMRALMRLVVTNGTASKANMSGYLVGGKTGTAEKTIGRGYSDHAQIASFVGAFPMDNPKYLVLVSVDEPKPNEHSFGYATAGWVAAPYAGNIIKEIAPIVGIRPKFDVNLANLKASAGLPQNSSDTLPTSMQLQGGRLASY